MKQLDAITTILDEQGVQYWLDSGTLLGLVRERCLLPTDPDIDISAWWDEGERVGRFVRLCKKAGYRVRARYYRGHLFSYSIIPRQGTKGHLRQVDLKLFRRCGPYAWCPSVLYIDRFGSKGKFGWHIWRYVRAGIWLTWTKVFPNTAYNHPIARLVVDVGCWWLPARYFKTLTRLENRYSVPSAFEEYLEMRYGDWRTPVKDWHYKKHDPTYQRVSPEQLFVLHGCQSDVKEG